MNWVMSNGNKRSSLRSLFTDVVFNWAFLFMPFWGVSSCILLCDVFFSKDLQAPSFYFLFSAQMTRFSFLARSQYVSSLFRFWINPEEWSPLHLHLDGVQMWNMRISTRCWKIWRIQCDLNKASRQKFDEKLWEWFLPSSCQIELKR